MNKQLYLAEKKKEKKKRARMLQATKQRSSKNQAVNQSEHWLGRLPVKKRFAFSVISFQKFITTLSINH